MTKNVGSSIEFWNTFEIPILILKCTCSGPNVEYQVIGNCEMDDKINKFCTKNIYKTRPNWTRKVLGIEKE